MPDLFRIFVTVSLVNLASRGLSTLAQDLLKVDMRTKSAQAAMSKLRSSLLIGGGMIMAGTAMTRFLGKAVDLAADVELSFTRLQSLTQANAEQMAEFSRQTQNAAHMTAIFSQKEMAEMGVTIEQSTKMSIAAINKTLPAFAMFAEAQQKLHGTSATAAVTAAGQMAKTMGLNPNEIPAFLEKLHRISAAMPKTAQLPALARDVNRPLAFMKGLGADREQQKELIQLQAMLISMGGGGATFGGRNLLMAMTRVLAPTKKGAEAQQILGITGRDETGKFNLMRMEEQMATVRARHPELKQPEFVKLMKDLFGQNALALAMRLSAPDIGKRKTEFMAAEARVDPIQTFVNKFLNTFAGAKTQLITDFASAMAEFGKHLLPVLTPLLHFFDNIVVAITKFMEAHPQLTKIAAVLMALGSAGLIAGGVATILIGVGSFVATIAPAAATVGPYLLAAAAAFAAVVAQGALLAAFFKKHPEEWKKLKMEMSVIMTDLKKLWIEMKPVLSEAAKVLKPLVEVWLEMFVTKIHLLLKAIQLFVSTAKFEMSGGVTGHLFDFIKSKLGGGKGTQQMGPPKPQAGIGLVKAPMAYHQPGLSGFDTPGVYHNQVAGIGLVKIVVNGTGDPKRVADEVVRKLAATTRQAAKGSGTAEELAYATSYMYT